MHEIEDERPIPVGRAAAAVRHEADSAADGSRGSLTHDCPEPSEPTPARPASADADRAGVPPPPPPPAPTSAPSHIERTRPETRSYDDGGAPLAAPGGHPLAALRGFQMEVELVEAAFPDWRRVLVRSLVAYVLVIGSILGLIAAFLVLTGHAGSGHP
jgi:pyruvate/2-oxoglutarate dehydrogenase complex dihydrolipoamide acyltransferase (E2) component